MSAERILTAIILGCLLSVNAYAEPDFNRLVNAIGKAENSKKFPYGIKSINTHGDAAYARKICLNSVRNQWKRHKAHHCGKSYLVCLRDRFCPLSDSPMNAHWIKNVSHFYPEVAHA